MLARGICAPYRNNEGAKETITNYEESKVAQSGFNVRLRDEKIPSEKRRFFWGELKKKIDGEKGAAEKTI